MKQNRKRYTLEFKRGAVALVIKQGQRLCRGSPAIERQRQRAEAVGKGAARPWPLGRSRPRPSVT